MIVMLTMFMGCQSFERYDPSPVGTFYPTRPIQGVELAKDDFFYTEYKISFSQPVKIAEVGIMTWDNLNDKKSEVALLKSPKLDHLPGDYYINIEGDYYANITWLKYYGRIEYTGYKTSGDYFWEGIVIFFTSPFGVILVLIVLAFFSYIIIRKPISDENNYGGYDSSSYSTTSYTLEDSSSSNLGNAEGEKETEKEKRIIGHTGYGERVNPETGVIQKEGLLGWVDTDKRIDPETGKFQKKGLIGWSDTETRIDQESGIIQKEGLIGYTDTNTKINPETGIIQKEGLFGWVDTDRRIDPETGKSQHEGLFGWVDD